MIRYHEYKSRHKARHKVIQDLTNTVPICKKGHCNTFHANPCNQEYKILSKIAFIAFMLSSIVGILKRNVYLC